MSVPFLVLRVVKITVRDWWDGREARNSSATRQQIENPRPLEKSVSIPIEIATWSGERDRVLLPKRNRQSGGTIPVGTRDQDKKLVLQTFLPLIRHDGSI